MADNARRSADSIDGRLERAKDLALGSHNGRPTRIDEIGEATGGITGVFVGAGIGSAAGPVGTLIGGIAGALGGWWTGRAVTEAASALSNVDDAHFRTHYETASGRLADRGYSDVRGAYFLGHIAAQNPNFTAREFAEVEPELERGWSRHATRHGTWATVRPFVQEGFDHGASRAAEQTRRMERRKSLGEEAERRR